MTMGSARTPDQAWPISLFSDVRVSFTRTATMEPSAKVTELGCFTTGLVMTGAGEASFVATEFRGCVCFWTPLRTGAGRQALDARVPPLAVGARWGRPESVQR